MVNSACGVQKVFMSNDVRPIWNVSRAEDRATQGCDPSADSEAEIGRAAQSRPSSEVGETKE
jgi:hypothetical protein